MKYLILLLTFFLFSLTVFAQVDKDDEFVSDVQWIIAPVDSMFIIEFTIHHKTVFNNTINKHHDNSRIVRKNY